MTAFSSTSTDTDDNESPTEPVETCTSADRPQNQLCHGHQCDPRFAPLDGNNTNPDEDASTTECNNGQDTQATTGLTTSPQAVQEQDTDGATRQQIGSMSRRSRKKSKAEEKATAASTHVRRRKNTPYPATISTNENQDDNLQHESVVPQETRPSTHRCSGHNEPETQRLPSQSKNEIRRQLREKQRRTAGAQRRYLSKLFNCAYSAAFLTSNTNRIASVLGVIGIFAAVCVTSTWWPHFTDEERADQ